MEIKYQTRSIEKVCTNATVAEKRYGLEMAEKIQMRIDQITAASSVEYLIQYHIGRCHPLHHNRKNQFGMDLVPCDLFLKKNGADIQIANIIEIVDYH